MEALTKESFEWDSDDYVRLADYQDVLTKSCPICGSVANTCHHGYDEMAQHLAGEGVDVKTWLQQVEPSAEVRGYRPPVAECDAPITTSNPKDAIGSAKAPTSTVSEAVLAEVGVGMMEGSRKYGRHNYRVAPIRAEVYYDAVHRHLRRWWAGEDIDADSGLSHITKAICTLFVLRDCMITGQLVDDRPPGIDPKFFDELDAKAAALVTKYPNPKAPVLAKDRA